MEQRPLAEAFQKQDQQGASASRQLLAPKGHFGHAPSSDWRLVRALDTVSQCH